MPHDIDSNVEEEVNDTLLFSHLLLPDMSKVSYHICRILLMFSNLIFQEYVFLSLAGLIPSVKFSSLRLSSCSDQITSDSFSIKVLSVSIF